MSQSQTSQLIIEQKLSKAAKKYQLVSEKSSAEGMKCTGEICQVFQMHTMHMANFCEHLSEVYRDIRNCWPLYMT